MEDLITNESSYSDNINININKSLNGSNKVSRKNY